MTLTFAVAVLLGGVVAASCAVGVVAALQRFGLASNVEPVLRCADGHRTSGWSAFAYVEAESADFVEIHRESGGAEFATKELPWRSAQRWTPTSARVGPQSEAA